MKIYCDGRCSTTALKKAIGCNGQRMPVRWLLHAGVLANATACIGLRTMRGKSWEIFITHLKKKGLLRWEQSFLNRCKKELLYLGNDSLECFGVIHGQVSENLTVDLDTSLVQKTHQLRIAQTLETSGSIDTLNPQ